MSRFPDVLGQRLAGVRARDLFREPKLPGGADFCSNDYLGFAADPELRARVTDALSRLREIGATGSRLLRGHSELHERAETALARFSEQEAALLYPSGYQANVGLLSAVLRPGDTVYSDELNHASIIDGVRLSGCRKRIYPHRDLGALSALLREDTRAEGLRVIVTESLFSMEGTLAPLGELLELAETHGAFVIVDEAHATGLWGGGLASSLGLAPRLLASVHTGGKALGIGGAWVAGSAELKSYLLNFSRAQIFSTAVVPFLAGALEAAVSYHSEIGVGRARELRARAREFRLSLGEQGSSHPESPIYPRMVGESRRALELARELQAGGFDVRAIRPPTVPDGSARLRLTLKWTDSEADLARLARRLKELA